MSDNFGRRYRIKIGVPEQPSFIIYECSIQANKTYSQTTLPDYAFSSPTVNTKPITPWSLTIPSDAVLLSNLPSDGNSLRGFDFEFSTKRTLSQESSKSEISTAKIKNLPSNVVNLLNTKGCMFQIEAAYKSKKALDLYYIGNVVMLNVRRSGADLDYIISLKDSGTSLENTKVVADFDETDSIADVVVTLGGMLGTPAQYTALEQLKDTYVTGGLSFDGNVADILKSLAKRYNFDYGLFNGNFIARMREIFSSDSNYNKLKNNTWVFDKEDNNILDIEQLNKNVEVATNEKSKKQVRVVTFLTAANIGEFFTIPPDIDKRTSGTYKISELHFEISSKGNFNTVFVGEEM